MNDKTMDSTEIQLEGNFVTRDSSHEVLSDCSSYLYQEIHPLCIFTGGLFKLIYFCLFIYYYYYYHHCCWFFKGGGGGINVTTYIMKTDEICS